MSKYARSTDVTPMYQPVVRGTLANSDDALANQLLEETQKSNSSGVFTTNES